MLVWAGLGLALLVSTPVSFRMLCRGLPSSQRLLRYQKHPEQVRSDRPGYYNNSQGRSGQVSERAL